VKIAVLNNYPLCRVKNEVLLGETPNHLLFGINYFEEYGIECDIIAPINKNALPLKYKILKYFHKINNLGDLYQQHKVIQNQKDYQLIYDACGNQTQWIQYLKSKGKFKPPIVSLHHHRVHRGKLDFLRKDFRKNSWHGLSSGPCLSKFVANDFNKTYLETKKAFPVQWGTDLSFYEPSEEVGKGLVVAGRTSRDFTTVIKAVDQTDLLVKIICVEGGVSHCNRKNIKIIEAKNEQPVPGSTNKGWIKQCDLNEFYRQARVIGIPLSRQQTLAGLTSLMDCLGIGKPVIMTKNPNIDIDIEKEGIGHWVEPGDVEEWKKILRWYDENPDQALEMGKKSRLLAERKYNSKAFASRMIKVFQKEILM
jgi:glycosyltransferase involved in cell wall biosynthesis